MLQSFIGGLKYEVKPFVKAFSTTSIFDTFRYAGLQEEQLKACAAKSTPKSNVTRPVTNYKPKQAFPNKGTASFQSNANKPPLLPLPPNTPRTNYRSYPHILADVRAEKIAKGLFYYCDKKYDKNHKCNFKQTQIFTVEVKGSET